MDILSITLTIIGIIIAIIFGYLQVVVPFIKREVRLSKRFPFVETAEAVPAAEPRKKRRKKRRKRRSLIPIFAIGVIVLIIVLIKVLVLQTTSLPPRPIAVMTFENLTGERSLDYLCKAIPNLLITNLEQSRHLSVMTWERMHDLLEAVGKEDVELIDEDLGFELCRMDGIETIVLGSFTKAGDIVVTDVKVLDVTTKKLLKTTSSKGEGVASILKVQIDELSREISRGVGLSERKVKITKLQIAEVTTSSMDAYNYFLRGREEYQKLYYDDARRFLEKAIELDSTFASAYLFLASTYRFLNDYKASNKTIEKAKEFSDKTTEKEKLYIEALYAFMIEDNPEKRFRILKQLAAKYPREKRVHDRLGWYYRSKDLFHRAIEEFNKTLELDPNYGEALNGLAYTYADIGDYAQAIEYFKQYAAVSPGDANPFDSMGELYFRMGQLDNALAKFKEAIEVKSDFMSSLKIAYIYALIENYDEAMKWTDHYITTAPSSGIRAGAYWQKAFYNYLLGKFDQALNRLDMAEDLSEPIEWEFGRMAVDWFRAYVYYDMKKYALSRNYFKDSYAYDPNSPFYTVSYNFNMGLIDLKQEKFNSARAWLALIKSLLPHVEIGEEDLALFLHDLLYAEVLLAQDSLEKAISVFEKTSKLIKVDLPTGPFTSVYNGLPHKDVVARVYYKKGDIDRAILEYEQLIDSDPDKRGRALIRPTWRYSLAKLYEEKGLKTKAIAEYEKFLDIWKDADADRPEKIDAKKRLAKLKAR
ncbi:MAG: tetratricopeptide repeat protein [candidate division WOR-3 bacterium]|nr:MAG: tetratricopeptide repeat protein [candidate division WOR-3 bacterium]